VLSKQNLFLNVKSSYMFQLAKLAIIKLNNKKVDKNITLMV